MRCKFPGKPCNDRYLKQEGSPKEQLTCRLPEWRKKKGTCPYDSRIRSKPKLPGARKRKRAWMDASQSTLEA